MFRRSLRSLLVRPSRELRKQIQQEEYTGDIGPSEFAADKPFPRQTSRIGDFFRLLCGGGVVMGCTIGAYALKDMFKKESEAFGCDPCPTSTMIELMDLLEEDPPKATDRFLDLGSGDGRVVIAVVETFGIESVGIENQPHLVQESKLMAKDRLSFKQQRMCKFHEDDMLLVNLQNIDIVFLYLNKAIIMQVICGVLPASGLKAGSRLIVADAPPEMRAKPEDYGCRGRRSRPATPDGVTLDEFEFIGKLDKDNRRNKWR